jgi:hypothetical protein
LFGDVAAESPWGGIGIGIVGGGVGDVEDERDVAGLEERVVGGFDGGCEDPEGIVADELLEEGDVCFSVDCAEIHDDLISVVRMVIVVCCRGRGYISSIV